MAAQVGGKSPAELSARLTALSQGAERLSGGMAQLVIGLDQVKTGVDMVSSLTGQLGAGLQDASSYLGGLSMHTTAGSG
ncbi:hypothetical protein PJM24_29105, partial [Mycobacterium kansasii]